MTLLVQAARFGYSSGAKERVAMVALPLDLDALAHE